MIRAEKRKAELTAEHKHSTAQQSRRTEQKNGV
jgi:hypothetical protein